MHPPGPDCIQGPLRDQDAKNSLAKNGCNHRQSVASLHSDAVCEQPVVA